MFFKWALPKEVNKWVQKEYITENQAQNILNHYTNSKEHKFSIITILGYFFLGLSLLVLIGHNWENIPVFIRAGGLISLTFFVQLFAYFKFLKQKNSNLFFLGNLLYGASIILIAQAYHLGTYAPDGVFWWAIGSFFIALLVKNRWVSLQAFLLALLWYFMEVSSFYPYLFWVFLAFCATILYKDKTNNPLFSLFLVSFSIFYLYTLSNFFYDNALTYDYARNYNIAHIGTASFVFLLIPTFAYLLLLVSFLIEKKQFLPYETYGAITKNISIATLYLSSFFLLSRGNYLSLLGVFEHYEKFAFFEILIALFLPIFIVSFLLKKRIFYSFTLLHVIFILLCFFMNVEFEFAFFVLINIAIFAIYAFLIYEGITKNSFAKYFLGILGILIFAMIRYIALIDDYVSASLLFLVCAIILLVASKLYKRFQRDVS